MEGCWRNHATAAATIGFMLLLVGCVSARPARSSANDPDKPGEGHLPARIAVASPIPAGFFNAAFGAPGVPPLASPRPLPACTYADLPVGGAHYDEWARTLVDTAYALPDSYVPPDLVSVSRAGIAGSGQIRAIVVDDLRALARAARDAGATLAVRSAYRSYRRQAAVFAGWEAASGHEEALRFSARPGHSEHQLGTALDLQAAGGAAPWQGNFAGTRQGRWLARNAWRYGFVVSYPPGSDGVVCYGAEAWHVRYVGRDVSRAVHRSGLTLREWLWAHPD